MVGTCPSEAHVSEFPDERSWQPPVWPLRLLSMRYAPVLAVLLLLPPLSFACSCMGPDPVFSAYWGSPVIFRGRMLEQALLSHTQARVKNLDGTTSTIEGPGYYRVRFPVVEMLKGGPRQQGITGLTNEQESACGVPFRNGGENIVYTYRKSDSHGHG